MKASKFVVFGKLKLPFNSIKRLNFLDLHVNIKNKLLTIVTK